MYHASSACNWRLFHGPIVYNLALSIYSRESRCGIFANVHKQTSSKCSFSSLNLHPIAGNCQHIVVVEHEGAFFSQVVCGHVIDVCAK